MSRALLILALAVLLGAPASTAASSPVIKLQTKTFGSILARRDHQALYFWNVEQQAGGKVRCTAACAQLWPPLLAKSAAAVPKRVAGIKGSFGVIRRPGGKLQVTYNRLPVYTYVHEGPDQVLCDDVDGWFVVRV